MTNFMLPRPCWAMCYKKTTPVSCDNDSLWHSKYLSVNCIGHKNQWNCHERSQCGCIMSTAQNGHNRAHTERTEWGKSLSCNHGDPKVVDPLPAGVPFHSLSSTVSRKYLCLWKLMGQWGRTNRKRNIGSQVQR